MIHKYTLSLSVWILNLSLYCLYDVKNIRLKLLRIKIFKQIVVLNICIWIKFKTRYAGLTVIFSILSN